MPCSHLQQLWHEVMYFEKLTYFEVESKYLTKIPDFSGAPCLKEVTFSGCESLPKVHPSIGNLSQLQRLSLTNCKSLEELPKEFNLESLFSLDLYRCLRLKKLPDLSRVPHIENINLFDCKSLRELPPSIGNLKRLQSLSLSSCGSLEELPNEINWQSLEELDLYWCSRLKKLPDLSRVPNVKKIILIGCKSLTKLHPSIGNLRRLQYLFLSTCESLEELPREIKWESLWRLDIAECLRLKKLHPSIGNLKQLHWLFLSNCENLKELPKEINCESLWHLDLDGCLLLEKLPDLSGSPNISHIKLSNCERLKELHPSIGNLKQLQSLPLKFCKSLEELPKEINWEALEKLKLRGCLRLKKLSNLSGVPNIKRIDLSDCESLRELHPSIGNLQQLQYLSLSRCKSLEEISKEINCKSLEKLYLDECLRLEKFPEIGDNMTALRKVNLRGTAIKWLPPSFQKLSSLQELLVGGSKRTEAIQPPHDNLPGRTGFSSSNYSNLRCFLVPNWLANFKFLRKLDLQYCNLSDESFPRDFSVTSVMDLNISGNRFTKIPEFHNLFPKAKRVGFDPDPLKALPRPWLELNISDCSLLGGAIWNDSLSAVYSLHLDESEFTRLTDNFCLLYNLQDLYLRKCRQLQSLPKLPLNLTFLDVTESPLLEMIYDQWDMETSWEALDACVCLWFSAASINGHDVTPYKIIQLQPPCPISKVKHACIYSSVSWGPTMRFEIPEWFQQRSIGLYGEFQSRVNEDWLGYALFVVYEVHEHGFPEFVCQFHVDDTAQEQPLVLRVPEARSVGENGFWAFLWRDTFARAFPQPPWDGGGTKEYGFSIISNSKAEIKECGARAVHSSEKSEFFHVLRSISQHGLELKELKEFWFVLDVGCQSEK